MNSQDLTKKEQIFNFIRDNKLKSFLVLVVISVFLFLGFKKESKSENELKEIKQLYKTVDNNDDLYKTKYFKENN